MWLVHGMIFNGVGLTIYIIYVCSRSIRRENVIANPEEC